MLMGVALVEEFLGNITPYRVARAILKAQDYREESWDGKKYILNNSQAALCACSDLEVGLEWSKYIAHWNDLIWNDVQGWAQAMVEKEDSMRPIGEA